MKKYKTVHWSNEIDAVEIDRENKSFIYIGTRLEAKRSAHINYYDTFEEAKEATIAKINKEISSCKIRLSGLYEKLDKIEKLEEAK